jgi:L-asparaginase II
MSETLSTSNRHSPFVELAHVRRSGMVESIHYGSLVALNADGSIALSLGDIDAQILPRSTVKPLQALACLRAGAPLHGNELAIAAGSHTGENEHVDLVRGILSKAGLTEESLACPVDWPEDELTRNALILSGHERTRIHMNCSGKHAAMLLACVANGWPTTGYLELHHPLQQLVRATIEELTGVVVDVDAIDGCGAPLFDTTVVGLARAFRSLVLAETGTAERAIADAMRANPFFVGGHHHANTDSMTAVSGLLIKGGAEGVISAAAATGEAVSMKIIDGNPRATTLIALRTLQALGVEIGHSESLTVLPVLGGGVRVGQIDIAPTLELALAKITEQIKR